MITHRGQRRSHSIVLVLLAMAILLDRYLIAGLFPWAPGLAGVNPMIVFLDIPVHLPVIIDLPVIGLFFFFYWILLISYPSRYGASTWRQLRKRLWNLFTGVLAILLCVATGGGIYYLSYGLMSRELRNGIDSFGIQADIYTPIPDHPIIHLRGSMILLICTFIGVRIFIKRTGNAGVVMETGTAGKTEPLLAEPPGRLIDPRIAGFQEKRQAAAVENMREPGTREVPGLLDAGTVRPRTAATSVPVVAPLPVNILSLGNKTDASPYGSKGGK